MSKNRFKERGYNQSGLLARELAKLIDLPLVDDCLVRERYTVPQAKTATVEQRLDNIINAFLCINNSLSGKKIILIDDVSTSGATLNACAAALKADGAASVWGLTLAREI